MNQSLGLQPEQIDVLATNSKAKLKDCLWREGNLSWKLHATQKIIHDNVAANPSDEILVFSSRQLGKSWWSVCYALEYCIKNPGCIVRILSDTLKHVQDIVNDNLNIIIQDAPTGFIERHKTAYRWTVGGNSSLRLGPLERAYVDYNRGGNAALIICEEGGFVRSEDYDYAIKSVIGAQLLRSSGKLIHVTTPSEDPLHIIHTEILPKTQLTNSFFQYTIYDNPQINEEQIEKAKERCGGESSAAWQREYMARIVRDPNSIIVPPFSRQRHVKSIQPPTKMNWQTVIDWGGVRDKTVALLVGYDFQENRMLVYKESVYNANTPTIDIVSGILEMEKSVPFVKARWADVPGQLQVDLHKLNFAIRIPNKTDWQAGINQMQVEFALNRIYVDENCPFLIISLESGMYNKNRTDFERSDVLGHCDALATLSYAVRMIDKSSPFPVYVPSDTLVFDRRDKTPEIQKLSESIIPKVFASDMSGSNKLKRFGTFNKK